MKSKEFARVGSCLKGGHDLIVSSYVGPEHDRHRVQFTIGNQYCGVDSGDAKALIRVLLAHYESLSDEGDKDK